MKIISEEQVKGKIDERIQERTQLYFPVGSVAEKENYLVIEELKYIRDVLLKECNNINVKKKSKWKKNLSLINTFYCESCGHTEKTKEKKYCPECGAEMERCRQ